MDASNSRMEAMSQGPALDAQGSPSITNTAICKAIYSQVAQACQGFMLFEMTGRRIVRPYLLV